MFLRSSAFRYYVRNDFQRCISSSTICTKGGCLPCSETKETIAEERKRVTIFLETFPGMLKKEIAYANETFYDMMRRIDPNWQVYTGFGICEGETSCSTCHIILKEKDFRELEPPGEDELDLLGYAQKNCEFSRLGCNLRITEEMDGIVVTLPSHTYFQDEDKQKDNGI